MNRRIAALALVALVALSGCAGFLGGSGTPTETTTGGTTATTAATTSTGTTTTPTQGILPGITDGEVTNATALVEHHTDLVAADGYVSSTHVVTEPRNGSSDAATAIDYRAAVEPGGHPYLIEVNQTRGGTVLQRRTIWSNESLRLERTRRQSQSGNSSTGYSRKSGQGLALDPGIKAFVQVFEAGDYRVDSVEGSGANRRITLVATAATEDGLAAAGANVTDYRGEVVVEGQGRIRKVEITMDYVDRNGRALTSRVSYRLRDDAKPSVARPDWIPAALNETSDITLAASAVDDTYIEIRNTGSEPITDSYRLVVATNQGAAIVDLNQSVAPGESAYIYQPKGGSAQLGYEKPTGELVPIKGTFQITLVDGDNKRITTVAVSV